MRSGKRGDLPVEHVATISDQLASLLDAGVAPAAAWIHVAAETSDDDCLRSVASAASRGNSVVAAIDRGGTRGPRDADRAWRELAASWWVASESGAPLAPCLRSLAAALRHEGETQRDVSVALAGPAATSRLVMALPALGVLFGALLGFDSLGALVGTPIGWGLLTAGAGLMTTGIVWTRRLSSKARSFAGSSGHELELLAVALSGGASVADARLLLSDVRRRLFAGAGSDDVGDDAERILALAGRAGAPAADLLRSEASHQRMRRRASGRAAAASLGVRLMIPLALCVLPAFMLLGVAPMVLAIVSSTFGSL